MITRKQAEDIALTLVGAEPEDDVLKCPAGSPPQRVRKRRITRAC
jgi:hypothetical protein